MRLYEIENKTYLGNCVNSFDEDGECIVPNLYNDVSDFAYSEENSIEISKNDFIKNVGNVQDNISNHLSKDVIYLHDQINDVFMIYDIDNDIHYFFK
jgi:hypothetical protein